MSLRILYAAFGAVFGLVWAFNSFGWAVVVILLGLVGYYIGATVEGDVDLSQLLAPLRQSRQ